MTLGFTDDVVKSPNFLFLMFPISSDVRLITQLGNWREADEQPNQDLKKGCALRNDTN